MQEAVVTTFHEARDAKTHKQLRMVRMRVVNERVAAIILGGNNLVEMGVTEIDVYERDVPAVLKEVEHDTAKLAAAKSMFETECAIDAAAKLGLDLTPEEVLAKIEDGHAELIAAHKEVLETTSSSIAGCFFTIAHRSMKPLTSAKVLTDEDAPINPHIAESRSQQKELADLVAKSTASATGGKGKSKKKSDDSGEDSSDEN